MLQLIHHNNNAIPQGGSWLILSGICGGHMLKDRPVIAIVYDDVVYLELLCDFLADEGYATICCRYGHEAQRMIRAGRPDLVILDVRLEQPESGWIVLELLRRV